MKKLTTLAVAALVLAFGASAMADQRQPEHEDIKIKCKFRGDAGKSKGSSQCWAFAKIEHDRKGPPAPPAPGTLNERERVDAFLKVVCDGEEIFKGDADIDHKHHFTIIEGEDSDVAIALSNKDWDNAVSAWLSLEDGSRLRGFCEIDEDKEEEWDMDFLF